MTAAALVFIEATANVVAATARLVAVTAHAVAVEASTARTRTPNHVPAWMTAGGHR